MHPILFRIPLPQFALPITWLFYAGAGAALLLALYTWVVQRNKAAAKIEVVVGGLIIIVRLLAGIKNDDVWQIGPLPIYSYGVMLGLSLVVGWYLTLGLAERDGLPKEVMANNYVVTAVAAVAGSRVLYILTNLNEFDSVNKLFAMRQGGLVAYGGFLGGLAGSYFFLRRHKIPLLPWADVAVPSLASGLMITRIGCYLFGCDFGKPLKETAPGWLKSLGTFPHWADGTIDQGTGSPAWAQHHNVKWAEFHQLKPLAADSAASYPVHPTQLYESLVGAGLLILLLWARRHQKFRGQIFFLFAFAYGICRYGLEILRDDAERGEIPPSLPEHILIPGGAALLALGYVLGFSKAIKNPLVQRVTQVLAFVPTVLLFIALKPTDFDNNVQFSTSQFIAVTTGFAASIAFSVFYKAALSHPESAMALNLPAAPTSTEPAKKDDEDDDDDDDDEDDDDDDDENEAPPPKKEAAKPKGTAAVAKAAVAKKPASSAKGKPAKAVAKKPAPKDEDEDEHDHEHDHEDSDDDGKR